ncbi:DUF418 domain-containing protein [Nocardia jinanensis]|uniref:DUF418 domain-containing protein n=1 Tax=Nocardia jinanensis TaxID=382504 RepID=A0A917R7E0_9NOCA|nr:DUF418 domain-containing protein [Nocardia jinanensis]GGK92595.1 hypothetical protein GCM10011588_03820 [Nocardia jinanensis]
MTRTVADPRVPGPNPSRPPRLAALDVLRGIAILGTLGTNVWILTDPEGLSGYLRRISISPTDGWMWAEKVLQQLAQGKFLGLLTVMFGIGLAIQQSSARRAGRPWPGGYPLRAGLLFLDGLLNFLLIAEFDVLMGYAATGLVVAFLLTRSERAQGRWLYTMLGVHLTAIALYAGSLLLAQPSAPRERAPLSPNPYADGSFWDLVLFRAENALVFRVEAIVILPLSIALFLLGARLFHAGVFRPEGARLRRRLVLVGFGVAAPIDLLAGLAGGGDLVLITRYLVAPVVSLGILALVAEFYVRRPRTGFAGRRLTEIGRAALSCYILQNLVASILCYGWGFGLAARFAPEARVPFTVAIYLTVCAVIALFAHLWLRRFERGPVEWLWHSSYRLLNRAQPATPR